MNKLAALAAQVLLLIAATVDAGAQALSWPRGMYCGGNQLIPEGSVLASKVKGVVLFDDDVMPNARVQVQVKGEANVLLEVTADSKGRFKVPSLRPGEYWLGVTQRGFNLHYWDLTVKRGSGTKVLRVALSLGN